MFCVCAGPNSVTLKFGDDTVTAVCTSCGCVEVVKGAGICDYEKSVRFSASWFKDGDVILVTVATPVALKDRGAYLVLHAVIDPVKQRIVRAEAEVRDESPI